MPMFAPTLLALLLLAPPANDECAEPALRALLNSHAYTRALARSKECARGSNDPFFAFTAAQAHYHLGNFDQARRSLQQYNDNASDSDRNQRAARLISDSLPPPTAAPKKPPVDKKPVDKERVDKKPEDKKPEDKEPPTEKTAEHTVVAPPNGGDNTRDQTTAPPQSTSTHVDTTRKPPVVLQPKPDLPPPVDEQRPEFRRGWIGLGVSAVGLGAVGLGLGVAGGLASRTALAENATALADAGLTESFDYAACTTESTDCEQANKIEKDSYSTQRYHEDLTRASRLQSAAFITTSVGVGSLLGALPVLARRRDVRRGLYIFTFVSGLVASGGGALLFITSRKSLGRALEGVGEPGGDWRVSRSQFWSSESPALGGATMIGVGAGLVIGTSVAVLTERLARSRGARARIHVNPTFGGLQIQGRF